jgi:hypothetical protein
MSMGVLTAATAHTEHCLPWWWLHYHYHNPYPVLFVDGGMSQEAKAWCQRRGTLLFLDPATYAQPRAMAHTPFTHTLWIDVHNQVRCDLGALFPLCQHPSGIAFAARHTHVLSFRSDATALRAWNASGSPPQAADVGAVPALYDQSAALPHSHDAAILRHESEARGGIRWQIHACNTLWMNLTFNESLSHA